MKRILIVLAAALLLAGCGDPLKGGGEGGNTGQIIIGSSDVPENLVIAQVYASALQRSGAKNVTIRPPVGGREVVVKALQDKSLSLTPDYSGNLLRYFDTKNTATESAKVYSDLRAALPPGFEILDQSPAQDKDVLAVTKETAAQGIHSMTELGPRCKNLVFGGPGQWSQRWKATIARLYGCTFKQITNTDSGGPVTISALRTGEVQVADLFSTDPRVKSSGFVQLADPKNMFPAQNIVPLAARGSLTPQQIQLLNKVSAALTTDRLTEINRQYTVEKLDPVDIAEKFLRTTDIS